jgi:hypothetical protein
VDGVAESGWRRLLGPGMNSRVGAASVGNCRQLTSGRILESCARTMRRLSNIPGITITLWLVWKAGLLLFTAQPVPANDAFFYDGAVVNYLQHGEYCNPSLAEVLPISGTEVFSAYPPLYQAVLWAWLKCLGTSALAVMWLHFGLLALFAGIVWAVFRQLQVPTALANLAALFLFGITFHDRPDTLAHVLGALTILAWARGLPWAGSVFLLLTFGTSLQIGGIYFLWAGALSVGASWAGKQKFPWDAWLTFAGVGLALVALVKFGYPRLWEGFQEHAAMTPSFTGFRLPQRDECLKVIRTAPGIFLAFALVPFALGQLSEVRQRLGQTPQLLVAVSGLIAAGALLFGSLFVLTANLIAIAGYLQPVLVGAFLAAFLAQRKLPRLPVWLGIIFLGAVALVSVRAIGMSTWGILCARDVTYSRAHQELNRALDAAPSERPVIISAAFLYETAKRSNLNWIHSDWPTRSVVNDWELRAIERLQPSLLVLTQFDYYRRYEPVIAQLRRERGDVEVRIHNLARVQAPDAEPKFRKVVQHISWAPVIIQIEWPAGANAATPDLK